MHLMGLIMKPSHAYAQLDQEFAWFFKCSKMLNLVGITG